MDSGIQMSVRTTSVSAGQDVLAMMRTAKTFAAAKLSFRKGKLITEARTVSGAARGRWRIMATGDSTAPTLRSRESLEALIFG